MRTRTRPLSTTEGWGAGLHVAHSAAMIPAPKLSVQSKKGALPRHQGDVSCRIMVWADGRPRGFPPCVRNRCPDELLRHTDRNLMDSRGREPSQPLCVFNVEFSRFKAEPTSDSEPTWSTH